ncbi:MAG: Vms1/Ankzf1 family peptidyl-tRNA hydrolase [Acidimicrobiia bacterium]
MISEERVRALALQEHDPGVTSCYLDVDGRRHPRPVDYELRLDHLLREARSRAEQTGNKLLLRSVEGDGERIGSFVRGGFDRSDVRGLAFFSCATAGFFEVLQLPRPVSNQVTLGRSPHVRQLEALLRHFERFAVVLVDRQRARLFRFELGSLTERTEVFDAVPRHIDQGGWSATNIQRHVDELAARHLRHAAAIAFEELSRRPVEHLVVGGPKEVVAAFEALLHPYLRDRVAHRLSVRVGATVEEIARLSLETEELVEQRRELELVARLRDRLGSGGAVAGLAPALEALVERRVDVLLVSDGFSAPGWRCGSCHFVGLRGRSCPACEAKMEAVEDVVEQAVEEALAQNCRVEVIRESADLDVAGRVGALLRY